MPVTMVDKQAQNMRRAQRRRSYDYPPRLPHGSDTNASEAIVINTGLSVVVRGHIVYLDRNEQARTATVAVRVLTGHIVDGTEVGELMAAASMLARRAERFLGIAWRIQNWNPTCDPSPSQDRDGNPSHEREGKTNETPMTGVPRKRAVSGDG